MSEHSQPQFYRSYWVETCTENFVSTTSWKIILPQLVIASSFKLEPFSPIFRFFYFFKNYSIGLYKCWNCGIGLKIGHAITRITRYTTVTINENSDHWARIKYGTDFSYHRVSIDTIFHVQSKTLVHRAQRSSSLFQQRCTK